MTLETANALIGILANNLNVVIENQNKLLALEKTLEESERVLYMSYSTHFERIRANSPDCGLLPVGAPHSHSSSKM